MEKIKKRINELGENLKNISKNLNGNHQRTIKEIEIINRHNQEIIDNLKERSKHQKGNRRMKVIFAYGLIFAIIAFTGAQINYNINGENILVVGENDSIFNNNLTIIGNLNVTGDIIVTTVIDNTIFAQLSSSVDQIPTNTTPTVITYDIQDAISGINHSTSVNPGELIIETAGVYFISPQPQVGKDMGGVKVDFDMFLQVDRNGTFINEPNSNIKLTIKDFDITDVIVLAFTIDLEVGDKIRMMQKASDDGVGMGLKNTNATADVPRTPSIIFTMYRVGG